MMDTKRRPRRCQRSEGRTVLTDVVDWLTGPNRMRTSKMRVRLVIIATTCLLVVYIVFNTQGANSIQQQNTVHKHRLSQTHHKLKEPVKERPIITDGDRGASHGKTMAAPPGPKREVLLAPLLNPHAATKGTTVVRKPPPPRPGQEEAPRPPPPGPKEQPHQRLRIVDTALKNQKMVGPLGQSNALHRIDSDIEIVATRPTAAGNGKGARANAGNLGGGIPSQPRLQRLVHLDLRVGPPNVAYLEQIFPLLSQWGATGLLIDYEENFPYSGLISSIASPKAYTRNDILRIGKSAKINNLDIIPLIQTFSNTEFILKHKEFEFLQERPNYLHNLNPAKNETKKLIAFMIDQVLELHPGVSHVHIGCEEVYHLGYSPESKAYLARTRHDASDLYVYYVMTVASHVRSRHPGIRVIVWDNVFRVIDDTVLQRNRIGDLVEPMISMYDTRAKLPISEETWGKYARLFPNLWIASYYNRPSPAIAKEPSVFRYTNNQKAWLSMLARVRNKVNIRGVTLIGLYKNNHLSPLGSVLLPAALPTLGMCLRTLAWGNLDLVTLRDVMTSFQCSTNKREDIYLEGIHSVFLSCRFPGFELYRDFVQLRSLITILENDKGLLGPKNYTILKGQFEQLLYTMPSHLLEIFNQETSQEWLSIHLVQNLDPLGSFKDDVKDFLLSKKWLSKFDKIPFRSGVKNYKHFHSISRRPLS